MRLSIIYVIGLVVLAVLSLTRKPDRVLSQDKTTRWLARAAYLLMGVNAAFFIFMGVGEMTGGDMSGAAHLIPAILLVVMVWLVSRRPLEGGIVLTLTGVLSMFTFVNFFEGQWSFSPGTALIVGGPFLLSGVLLLLAVWLAWRKAPQR